MKIELSSKYEVGDRVWYDGSEGVIVKEVEFIGGGWQYLCPPLVYFMPEYRFRPYQTTSSVGWHDEEKDGLYDWGY